MADENKVNIEKFQNWTNWVTTGGNAIRVIDAILKKTMGDTDVEMKIDGVLRATYVELESIDKELNVAITLLKAGKPVNIELGEETLPDWPTSEKPEVISSFLSTVKPILEKVLQKGIESHPDSPFLVALEGVISSFDQLSEILESTFKAMLPA